MAGQADDRGKPRHSNPEQSYEKPPDCESSQLNLMRSNLIKSPRTASGGAFVATPPTLPGLSSPLRLSVFGQGCV